MLASRLPSTSHTFSLVMLAAGLFAGWPTLAKGVRVSWVGHTVTDSAGVGKAVLDRAHIVHGLARVLHASHPGHDRDLSRHTRRREPRRAAHAVVRVAVEAAARGRLGRRRRAPPPQAAGSLREQCLYQ